MNGRLAAGGQLFMLKVKGKNKVNLGDSYKNGQTFDVEWVPIAKPDNPNRNAPSDHVWAQGRALGAATFQRLEGCWSGVDRKIYIVSTNGGRGQGQIWVHNPAAENISLLFESPGKDVLDKPDHMTVSPRGGLVLCEDGGGDEFLHGLTTDGQIFSFAQNNVKLRGERNGLTGDFTTPNGPARATARMESGCSPTSSIPGSPWRSRAPGSRARLGSLSGLGLPRQPVFIRAVSQLQDAHRAAAAVPCPRICPSASGRGTKDRRSDL